MNQRNIFNTILFSIVLLFLSGCLGGQDDGSFSDLINGDVEDINELTLDSVSPDVEALVLELNQNQTFFVSARAPTGRVLSYSWFVNGIDQGIGQSAFSFLGDASNIGNRSVEVRVSDGLVTKTKSWAVKVNGPPSLTAVTLGTPKVSVGSTINISATGSDPNGDDLSYTWTLNGVSSSYLVGSGSTAVLTGHESIVGSINIAAQVSDGSATAEVLWTAEVNHFPNACNGLSQGQICTYAGSPSIGDGEDPLNTNLDLKIRPIAQTQDDLGNFFIADDSSNVIFYWNKTASAVSRLGVTVPANQIKVVAGTGEEGTGADGIALESAINNPRGLAYDPSSQRLYISEYSSSRVRYVDSSGFIYTGMGGGSSQVNGAAAFTHGCSNPAGIALYNDSLYVACRNHHRVKRWDLSTDLAYTVFGTGGGNFNNMGGVATSAGASRAYHVFVNSDGIYVSHLETHRVTFVNHSGAAKTFWSATSPRTIDDGDVHFIAGTGTNNDTENAVPTSAHIGEPTSLVVHGDLIIQSRRRGSRDAIYIMNNSASPYSIGGVTVAAGQIRRITSSANAGYNGSGLNSSLTRINEPYSLSIDPLDANLIHFSSYNNFRLRTLSLASGQIADLVGSGKLRNGFYGDTSKPSLEHLFNSVHGVAFDSQSRELFFADGANCRVRRVNAFGEIDTIVSRGCGDPTIDNDIPSNAYLRNNFNTTNATIAALGLLSDRSLVIGNPYSHNIRVWNRTSIGQIYFNTYLQGDRVSNIAGNYLASGNGGDGPATGISMLYSTSAKYNSNDGKLYIVDSKNHCIRALDSSGELTQVLGVCGTAGNSSGSQVAVGSLELNTPTDIAFDEAGNVYFTDRSNHKIRVWNRSASDLTIGPISVSSGSVGTIACVNGSAGSTSENILSTSALCNLPTGIAISTDSICFTNYGQHNVRCINRTGANPGRINTFAGYPAANARAGSPVGFEQEGVQGTSATLYNPSALAFDDNGDLFIADTSNHIVRKLKMSAD